MPKVLENMTPWRAKKLEKKTKEVPNASKEDPRELQQRSGAPEANQGWKASNSLSKTDVFKKNHQIP